MNIAILGSGPSGSVLAALLADSGHTVVVFDENKRPEMLVGESLVPGLIPLLRRPGIEDRVAKIGVLKPGVSFYPSSSKEVIFRFASQPRRYPNYAYNAPAGV
jgi:2-polyprenyl-6-methoxyphenol hydroxylase-like FAD-dependent oxidoreductase